MYHTNKEPPQYNEDKMNAIIWNVAQDVRVEQYYSSLSITKDTLNNVRDNKLLLWPYNQIGVIKERYNNLHIRYIYLPIMLLLKKFSIAEKLKGVVYNDC
jgi:hypothetical protein